MSSNRPFEFKADSNPPIGVYEVDNKSKITGGYIEPEAERIHMFSDTSMNMTSKSGNWKANTSVNTSLVKSPSGAKQRPKSELKGQTRNYLQK